MGQILGEKNGQIMEPVHSPFHRLQSHQCNHKQTTTTQSDTTFSNLSVVIWTGCSKGTACEMECQNVEQFKGTF
jgi:hypothetical protein